jgi:hypothetical protein
VIVHVELARAGELARWCAGAVAGRDDLQADRLARLSRAVEHEADYARGRDLHDLPVIDRPSARFIGEILRTDAHVRALRAARGLTNYPKEPMS